MKTEIKKENIILMGMKHVGKSSLGKKLAKDINCDFYDLDHIIEKNYDRELTKNVREIYTKEGVEVFRDLEAEASCIISNKMNERKSIIFSLGGSTIENSSAMSCIKDSGLMIYLKDQADHIYKRILKGGIPPFIDKKDPYKSFLSKYKKRDGLYQKKADIIIDINGKNFEEAYAHLKSSLKEFGYAW